MKSVVKTRKIAYWRLIGQRWRKRRESHVTALERHNNLADERQPCRSTVPVIPAWVTSISPEVHAVLVPVMVVWFSRPPEGEGHRPLCAHPRPFALHRHVIRSCPHVGTAPLRYIHSQQPICQSINCNTFVRRILSMLCCPRYDRLITDSLLFNNIWRVPSL